MAEATNNFEEVHSGGSLLNDHKEGNGDTEYPVQGSPINTSDAGQHPTPAPMGRNSPKF